MNSKNVHSNPLVTVVIATYNRPETLRYAVKSVLYQTMQKWKLLVIGDKCDNRTKEVMDEFTSDDRVHYVNISKRTGSQALPNSAGMQLAETRYISLLNHDDLWLPDHLEIAIDSLEKNQKANLYIGRSLKVNRSGEDETQWYYTHRNLQMKDTFSNINLFEPASAWVFKKDLADKTGPWKSPNKIFRTPLQDWSQRAWRAGAVLITDEKVTCIKIETHSNDSSVDRVYESAADEHKKMFIKLSGISSDTFRKELAKETIKTEKKSRRDDLSKKIMNYLTHSNFFSFLYFKTSFDIYSFIARISGRKKGWIMDKLLLMRTKEKIESFPSLQEIKRDISKTLEN